MNDNTTGNIVNFPPKKEDEPEKLILVCTDCNCQSFWHYSTGEIECCNCNTIMGNSTTTWRKEFEPVPDSTEVLETNSGNITIKQYGGAEFAQKHVITKIDKWRKDGDLALIVGYHNSGEGTHWVNHETDEQRSWLIRKLQFVIDSIKWYKKPE